MVTMVTMMKIDELFSTDLRFRGSWATIMQEYLEKEWTTMLARGQWTQLDTQSMNGMTTYGFHLSWLFEKKKWKR